MREASHTYACTRRTYTRPCMYSTLVSVGRAGPDGIDLSPVSPRPNFCFSHTRPMRHSSYSTSPLSDRDSLNTSRAHFSHISPSPVHTTITTCLQESSCGPRFHASLQTILPWRFIFLSNLLLLLLFFCQHPCNHHCNCPVASMKSSLPSYLFVTLWTC